MIQKRDIAMNVVLTVVTCGIYGLVWFVQITNDMRKASGDETLKGGMDLLLGIITCGIWYIYWAYKMGQAATKALEKANLPTNDNAILYLVIQLFGLSIVNYALIQNDLNKIASQES